MSQRNRFSLLILIVVISLLANAIWTVSARADDGAPPPPQTPSGGTNTKTSSSTVISVPTNVISNVPSGTEVVVLDRSHKRLPLASQAAADTIASGDPIWCPSTVAVPTAGSGGCTTGYGSFATLLADPIFSLGGPSVNGTIWIDKTYLNNDVAPIVISGLTYTNMANAQLTLKGGWFGSGTGAIDTTSPSDFDVPITISDWNNNVTLSDIVITGASGGVNALLVTTTKNITLTRVNSHDNLGSLKGAFIDDSGGTGNVLITSSHFDNNAGANGLLVYSRGTITLSNVTTVGNTAGTGAFLDNHTALTAKNVMLTGDNTFNNSFYDGLEVWSEGAITANDITANDNGLGLGIGYGAVLDNTYGSAAPINLTGTNIFTENYQGGLYVSSNGPITGHNLIANSNTHGVGASLINSGASTAQPVALTGTSQFNYNNTYGLFVNSNGQITLSNITASYNKTNTGASLSNQNPPFSAGITLTGTNTFNGDYSTGLSVLSFGSVNLNSVTAQDNGLVALDGYGLFINNVNNATKSVTLTGTNNLNHNYLDGLYIGTKGKISLSNITANGSVNGSGATLYNGYTGVASGVTLAGINDFENNDSTGLYVTSLGPITTNNITADGNGTIASGANGVYLDNCIFGITGCTTLSTQPVTVKGVNNFNNNFYSGLVVVSRGNITVSSTTADGNAIVPTYGYGVWLDNCQWNGSNCSGSGSVILTGSSTLDANYYYGAYITTSGTITLSNITAGNSVHASGIYINNTYSGSLTPRNVTLSGTNVFDSNWSDGLDINTYGVITLNNITANDNGQNGTFGVGANLTNNTGTLSRDVILTGINTFSQNYTDGLDIDSLGNIKINSVTASNNLHGLGSNLDNQFGSVTTGVTLTGTNTFSSNHSDGLDINSYGAITVNNTTASENGLAASGAGAAFNNYGGTLVENVTLTGTNIFDHNHDTGLAINTKGSIKINNLSADDSVNSYGANLTNTFGLSTLTPSITLTGKGSFNSNYTSGLYINSYGVISINTTSLIADKNGLASSFGYGVYGDNSSSTAVNKPGVTIMGVNTLDGNYNAGIYVNSKGTISLNSITASGTVSGNGAQVSNHTDGKGVILTGTNIFNSNNFYGLAIGSQGAVTVSGVTANDNLLGGVSITTTGAVSMKNMTAINNQNVDGVIVDNSSASTAQAVTLTGTNIFNDNFDDGLNILSIGAITTNNVTANLNGQNGVTLDNHLGTGGVTMNGVNTAYKNSVLGVKVYTTGAVNLTSMTVDGNTGTGLVVDASSANVKVTCGSFTNNGGNGLSVSTSGTLTLIGVVASGNGASNIFFGGTPIVVRNCPFTP